MSQLGPYACDQLFRSIKLLLQLQHPIQRQLRIARNVRLHKYFLVVRFGAKRIEAIGEIFK